MKHANILLVLTLALILNAGGCRFAPAPAAPALENVTRMADPDYVTAGFSRIIAWTDQRGANFSGTFDTSRPPSSWDFQLFLWDDMSEPGSPCLVVQPDASIDWCADWSLVKGKALCAKSPTSLQILIPRTIIGPAIYHYGQVETFRDGTMISADDFAFEPR